MNIGKFIRASSPDTDCEVVWCSFCLDTGAFLERVVIYFYDDHKSTRTTVFENEPSKILIGAIFYNRNE